MLKQKAMMKRRMQERQQLCRYLFALHCDHIQFCSQLPPYNYAMPFGQLTYNQSFIADPRPTTKETTITQVSLAVCAPLCDTFTTAPLFEIFEINMPFRATTWLVFWEFHALLFWLFNYGQTYRYSRALRMICTTGSHLATTIFRVGCGKN